MDCVKEHLKAPSPIYDHFNITGHTTTIDNFSIVGREDQNLIRTIKEAIYIKVNRGVPDNAISACSSFLLHLFRVGLALGTISITILLFQPFETSSSPQSFKVFCHL